MAKTTFATIGILTLLLLSLGMVSAAVDNFELTIMGDGTTSSRLTGSNDSTNPITIKVDNTNSTFGNVYINWSVASTTNMILPDGENITLDVTKDITGFILTMPYKSSSYVRLTANIYSEDQTTSLGTEYINIYFNNTDYIESTEDPIPGCKDPSANNYNPDATEDDGSCTYNTTPTGNFCEIEIGDLKITDVTFDNYGEGDDEEWYLLDEVEIEVEIENTHNTDDIKNVLVEIMILDEDGYDVTKDFEFEDTEIDLNTIKDDDYESAIFKISELPADLEAGDYKLYVRAYSENEEEAQCVSTAASKYLNKESYQEIEVTREDDPAVIIKETTLTSLASCGDKNIHLPISVYNLGSDKEDKVLVTLINSELGINEKIIIDNLKSGKREEIDFYFDVPEGLSKNTYTLYITTYYDYDDDENEMEISSYGESSYNDLDKTFPVRLEILSCQGAPNAEIQIDLESETVVGKKVVIKATITNNGEDSNFAISISGLESWAESITISPLTTSINKGESAEITITFIPTATGENTFKINAISDGQTISKQVVINIKEKPSLFSGISNGILYTIAGIAAVLILIFLVLIVKISRRQSKPQF